MLTERGERGERGREAWERLGKRRTLPHALVVQDVKGRVLDLVVLEDADNLLREAASGEDARGEGQQSGRQYPLRRSLCRPRRPDSTKVRKSADAPRSVAVALHEEDDVGLLHQRLAPLLQLLVALLLDLVAVLVPTTRDRPTRARRPSRLLARLVDCLGGDGLLRRGREGRGLGGVRLERCGEDGGLGAGEAREERVSL